MPRNFRHLHPIGCTCCACTPVAQSRASFTIRALTRARLLVAALLAIPFIIAHAFACARGDNR
ncbi:hypothetical protein [Croceibacterium ferulae]|uniref:hypothetical protein n=1 Tax=Croceibacterium ferulae TaxID=1854641 RepID=UPI000EACAA18|nr:hypothetical protein [Croceibacterium ferulae]